MSSTSGTSGAAFILLSDTTILVLCRPMRGSRLASLMMRLMILLLVHVSGKAQESVVATDGFMRKDSSSARKTIAGVMVGGMLAVSLKWSYDTWWAEERIPFYFASENWLSGEHRGIDKIGHLYTSYFYFHILRNVMLWGGYDASSARWWGAGAAAFFAVTVELGDAVGGPGFDYQDLVFNAAGVGYAWLQTDVPFLRNFNFKWMYLPAGGLEWPPRFTKNYDAHTYWLTANVNSLLPDIIESYWPDWLQIGVGYGVDERMTKREFLIGLDIDLDVFSTTSEDVLLLRKTLNMLHIPAPAVKFTEDRAPRYYLLQRN
jgi:hypothetical protein